MNSSPFVMSSINVLIEVEDNTPSVFKYDLTKLSDSADQVSRWMNETYKGTLDV
jgi:hypothetical protein